MRGEEQAEWERLRWEGEGDKERGKGGGSGRIRQGRRHGLGARSRERERECVQVQWVVDGAVKAAVWTSVRQALEIAVGWRRPKL